MATTNDWFIFKAKISKLDFYLPQYNLFVEYWGLVDSPDPGTRDNYHQDNALESGTVPQEQHQLHLNIPLKLDYNLRRRFSEAMGFNLLNCSTVATCPTSFGNLW